MKIREITDKAAWNDFVASCSPNTFLQSWEWGQVQKRTGEGVRYLGVFEETPETPAGQQIAAALVVIVNARRGKFLLIPHGPLFKLEKKARPKHLLPSSIAYTELESSTPEAVFHVLINYCRRLAEQEHAVVLRVAPLLETTIENRKLMSNLEFRPAPIHIHAELTWVLDITPSEDDILSGMRKTTRHAIRRAEKAGVSVKFISTASGLEHFWPLYETTTQRHGFTPFSHEFLRAQAEEFLQHDLGYFAVATHNGQDVAAALVVHFGDSVFYHHGASLPLPSSLPAAQFLQWESIREAKRRAAKHYNFWGIAPENQPHHPFTGITTFKKGFGGRAIDYMHAQDLPFSMWYWKLWLIDTWRKKQRGF